MNNAATKSAAIKVALQTLMAECETANDAALVADILAAQAKMLEASAWGNVAAAAKASRERDNQLKFLG